MSVAIIHYGSINLRSAAKAFERAAREAGLADRVQVTASPEAVLRAERIVLPGVGAFGDCRAGLDSLDGMVEALHEAVIGHARPFLGICVGMQLMVDVGREHGDHPGLGWIPGDVVALDVGEPLKVPHMGWNGLEMTGPEHPVLAGLAPDTHVYFVHGYRVRATEPEHVLARVDYGGEVAAIIGRDNLIGTQFHPEKSQAAGLAIIGNFLRWRP